VFSQKTSKNYSLQTSVYLRKHLCQT